MPNRRSEEIGSEDDDGAEKSRQSKPNNWNAVLVTMAITGIGGAAGLIYRNRPQDPILEVQSIVLRGFDLHTSTDSVLLAVVDVNLTLYVKIQNPNIAPITFSTTIMDIYYKGSLLGQAKIYPGDQQARSEQILAIPAKMDGLEATHHLKDLFLDVTRREMVLHATATINGHIAIWRYRHRFQVYVNSKIVVDPILLDVIDQHHRADLAIEGIELPGMDK